MNGGKLGPPSGVVTFLFTDIEGSTRRWEADADAMRAALAVHDEVFRRQPVGERDGFVRGPCDHDRAVRVERAGRDPASSRRGRHR